jgi:hypothetical protein
VTAAGPWWRVPLRVQLPWSADAAPTEVSVGVGPVQRVARVAAVVIPWVLVVLGSALAVAAAVVIERDLSDAAGGLGIELGAALWFAGVLALGARRGATVGRIVALAVLALAGAALVAVAVLAEWSGAALDLALEFGVGAMAVAVIDVVLIGTLHSRLERLGDAETQVVTVRIGGGRPWIAAGARPAGTEGPAAAPDAPTADG